MGPLGFLPVVVYVYRYRFFHGFPDGRTHSLHPKSGAEGRPMPAPATIAEFVELGCKAGLLEKTQAAAYCQSAGQAREAVSNPQQLAEQLVRAGLLTNFQAQQL